MTLLSTPGKNILEPAIAQTGGINLVPFADELVLPDWSAERRLPP